MYKNELWQKFSASGEPLMNSGYPASLGNPKLGSGTTVGGCCVWLYRHNSSGEIEVLFQKRSKFVDSNAEKWDVSAGGHINYGELPLDAAVREAKEEIGATLERDKVRFIYSDVSTLYIDRICFTYCYDWDKNEDNFAFDDKEVSEVKWVPLSEFDNFMDENAKQILRDDCPCRELIKTFLECRGNL